MWPAMGSTAQQLALWELLKMPLRLLNSCPDMAQPSDECPGPAMRAPLHVCSFACSQHLLSPKNHHKYCKSWFLMRLRFSALLVQAGLQLLYHKNSFIVIENELKSIQGITYTHSAELQLLQCLTFEKSWKQMSLIF